MRRMFLPIGFIGLALAASSTFAVFGLGTEHGATLLRSAPSDRGRDLLATNRLPQLALFWRVPAADPGGGLSRDVSAARAAESATNIVLNAADVGPDFVVATSGDVKVSGFTVRSQSMVRAGRNTYYVEPDGIFFVRSVALVTPDVPSADQAFNDFGKLFEGTQELPLPPIANRARGAVEWGEDPFDAAAKIVLFRQGPVVGYVIVGGFEAPNNLDDVLPLAQKMIARSR